MTENEIGKVVVDGLCMNDWRFEEGFRADIIGKTLASLRETKITSEPGGSAKAAPRHR
jgi:hypothetical protein